MRFDKNSLMLYLVTDRAWLNGARLCDRVEEAIAGGVTLVQIREKDLNDAEFEQEARAVKAVTDRYGVPYVVNDNIDVALKIDADGVHVGQHDMAAQDVRALIGPDKILGVSAQTVEQALLAEANGADYLGVGAVFSTATKADADAVSLDTLREICAAVSIPVVAIGGIGAHNMEKLTGTGIAGAAVVSAIMAQPDVCGAAKQLRDMITHATEQ